MFNNNFFKLINYLLFHFFRYLKEIILALILTITFLFDISDINDFLKNNIKFFEDIPEITLSLIFSIFFLVYFLTKTISIVINQDKLFLLKKPSKIFYGHTFKINSLSFDTSEKYILSSSDSISIIWDIKKQEIFKELRSNNWIGNALFTKDNKQVIAVGKNGNLILWDIENSNKILEKPIHENHCRALDYSKELDIYCSGSKDGSYLLFHKDNINEKISKPIINIKIKISEGEIRKISFSPNRNEFLACDSKGNIHKIIIINGLSYAKILMSHPQNRSILNIKYHPSGQSCVFVDYIGNIFFYNLCTEEIIYKMKAHNGPIMACAISSNGNYFATAGQDRKIIIWKINKNRFRKHIEINVSDNRVTSLIFSKNNKLYSAGDDKNIYEWDINKFLF